MKFIKNNINYLIQISFSLYKMKIGKYTKIYLMLKKVNKSLKRIIRIQRVSPSKNEKIKIIFGIWIISSDANTKIKYKSLELYKNFLIINLMLVLLIPRAPVVPRSCQMDGHAISTHKGSWFSRYTCKRHPDRVSGCTLRWFC